MKFTEQDTRRWRHIVHHWQRDLHAWRASSDTRNGAAQVEDPLEGIGVREQRLLLAAGSALCAIDTFV
jgi:hypothetical protein